MKTYTYSQLEQEKFIKINNEYLNSKFIKEFDIDSILILSVLLKNYTVRGELIFSLNYIYDELEIKKNNSNKMNKVKVVLSNLASAGILDTEIDFMKVSNDTIIKFNYDLPSDNFTVIYDFEFDAIINSNTKVDKYAMFYLFVFMKYRMNVITRVMYWSIKDMANEMNTKSNKTIISYIDTLQELGLLKIDNVGMRVFQDGEVRNSNNVYTLGYLEDADKILKTHNDKYKAELEENNVKLENGKKAREQTSVKLKMNNKQRKYDYGNMSGEEMAELYDIEEKYYNFIKNDIDKVNNTRFVLFGSVELEELFA